MLGVRGTGGHAAWRPARGGLGGPAPRALSSLQCGGLWPAAHTAAERV